MMELAERLSYYGINQGLKNFMTKHLLWSQVKANSLKSTWTSLCYLSPLFGAYIADQKWGRFRTILVFGCWYAIGDFLVAIAAHPTLVKDHRSTATVIFVIGLFVGLGIGTGAIKSNVITLGADQFDVNDPKEVEQKETYFSYFYWCINLGAGFSYGYLSILCVDGSGQISQNYGYFATYLICACVMVVALIILVIGYPRYVHFPPSESALTKLCSVLIGSCRYSFGAKMVVLGFLSYLAAFIVNLVSAFLADSGKISEHLSYLAGALVLLGVVLWVVFGMNPSFLDKSKVSRGGPYDDALVDEIKRVVRVFPYASFTIIWQCAYDQIDANFQAITQQCDLRWFGHGGQTAKQVPGAMLGVFDPIAIVILIPILDMLVYPAYHKLAGKPASAFGKTAVGLVVSALGLLWAGVFETIRRNRAVLIGVDGKPLTDKGSGMPMNDIIWAAAIPNYLLTALAECLINVTCYDVFYSEVPFFLKSTCQAINLFMTSQGSILASIFTIMFAPYITDDLNKSNIEYMYYCIVGVSVINLAGFVYVMIKMQFGMENGHNEYDEGLLNKDSVSSRNSIAKTK